MIYGHELQPNCHVNLSNHYMLDKTFCNVFYRCESGRTAAFICSEGQAFEASTNTHDQGKCRPESIVDCGHRLIVTAQGQHPNRKATEPSTQTMPVVDVKLVLGKSLSHPQSKLILLPPPVPNQKEVMNVPFDCKGRIDGHWRDTQYCDIFHACLAGEQKRSYGCNQISERFYFDDASQK